MNHFHRFLVICIAALSLAGCNSHTNEKQEEAHFTVTNPAQKDTLIYHEYVCQIRSIQHIELRALEKGYLQHIYVDEGQFVKKGQLLFQIMPTIYQAEKQKSQAEASFAEIEYQNTKNLNDSNVVSKNELALAKAKLEKAKAELSLAQAHLSFTEIRAPFDGIVGRFNDVRLGSLVDEGDLITTISDNGKMWVYFNVSEVEYLNYMKPKKTDAHLKVKLRLANGKEFETEGVVETIEADFNNETGNIAFRATFQNPNTILRNGETGSILVPVKLTNALLIPQIATFEILDKKYVYTINEQGVVKSTEIKIGSEIPHIYAVDAGLTNKDMILVDGIRKVKNGETIKYKTESFEKIVSELNYLHAE
jgi:membrane fusion protein (multidrug efflux system)